MRRNSSRQQQQQQQQQQQGQRPRPGMQITAPMSPPHPHARQYPQGMYSPQTTSRTAYYRPQTSPQQRSPQSVQQSPALSGHTQQTGSSPSGSQYSRASQQRTQGVSTGTQATPMTPQQQFRHDFPHLNHHGNPQNMSQAWEQEFYNRGGTGPRRFQSATEKWYATFSERGYGKRPGR